MAATGEADGGGGEEAPGAAVPPGRGRSRRPLLWAVGAALVLAALGLGLGLGLTGGGTGSGGGTAAATTTTTTGGSGTGGGSTTTTTTTTSGGSSTTNSSSTTNGSGPAALVPGTYVAGRSGTPHYELVLADADPTSLGGSVVFVYQDGTTATVLTFTGTSAGQQATLHAAAARQDTGRGGQQAAAIPATITADLGQGIIDLTGCTGFLHYAHTPSDCTFTYTAGGTG
ncbi:MAG: hypothetical protein ACRDZR_04745 [Acidimicrobiales bacterium]